MLDGHTSKQINIPLVSKSNQRPKNSVKRRKRKKGNLNRKELTNPSKFEPQFLRVVKFWRKGVRELKRKTCFISFPTPHKISEHSIIGFSRGVNSVGCIHNHQRGFIGWAQTIRGWIFLQWLSACERARGSQKLLRQKPQKREGYLSLRSKA